MDDHLDNDGSGLSHPEQPEQDHEREQVEYVFGLTGGELNEKPWVVQNTDGLEWRFVYTYDGAPTYSDESSDYDNEYVTVVQCCLFESGPDVLVGEGQAWDLVKSFLSSGETECPGRQVEQDKGHDPTEGKVCPLCERAPGGKHGDIYIGDGWCELVYRKRALKQ